MSQSHDNLLHETRQFAPSPEFVAQANATEAGIYEEANADYQGWWEKWARELTWTKDFHTVCEFEAPDAKWFVGGQLNAASNCVDRHAEAQPDKVAIIAEGEPGDVTTWTYAELRDRVCQIANGLKELGVSKGDRVCIYLPMVPELPATMLACARIGAAHTVVFGGFTAESLQERTNDAEAKVIVTADGGWRRGKIVPLQGITEEALAKGCPTVEKVLVLNRTNHVELPADDRFVGWHGGVLSQSIDCACEPMDSEDLLFILYTSGSTGKPKGIVHTTGGYLTHVYATSKLTFDLKVDDIFFCTADCGWVTGHSYITYGPLANGATVLIYEGAPDTPGRDRFWQIIQKHRATILYTAPTAIRTFMKWGAELPAGCDLSSLRLLGSVGEPINPEAWVWYHEHIGHGRCPIVDTWWQTETGGHMITTLPGVTACKPGSAGYPFPGIQVRVLDEAGQGPTVHGPLLDGSSEIEASRGFLVIDRPWPGMTRGIFRDPERFKQTYWSKFEGKYFAGDGIAQDADGFLWLLGRVDDIMLVAGHNISTMEVESALVDHPAVAEAAVIGKSHDLKGQAIAAFVILKQEYADQAGDALIEQIRKHVAVKIGPIARPDDLYLCGELPKTRSGKIMRRLLRDIAEGRALGDTTTLADPNVVNSLKGQYEEKEG